MSQEKNNMESTNGTLMNEENIKKEVNIEDDHLNKENNKKRYLNWNDSKKILSIVLIAIIGVGIGLYAGVEVGRGLPATHRYYKKSKVFATVGDTKITGDDFNKRMEVYFYYQGLNKLSDEEIESYEVNAINYMTNLEALYLAGKEDNIEISDEDLESNYTSTLSSILSALNFSEDEFMKKFDLTEEYIKTSLEKEMIATEYLTTNSEVSDEEAENYYEKNKEDFFEISASHILISNYDENGEEVSDEQKEENKELAESLLKRLKNGESFDDLALEYSDDSNTASSGGDLGYFSEGEMESNFDTAAFSLEKGELYDSVVETSYGYHIIKKTGEQYSDFDDIKDSLIESLVSDKQSNLLEDALDKYDVKVNM